MRMNNSKIKEIYRASVLENTPPSREKCPSPEEIWKLFASFPPDKETEKIIDHITGCTFCLQEFDNFLEIFRHEQKLIKEIGYLLVQEGHQPFCLKSNKFKIFKSSPSWRYAFIALAAVTFIFFISLSILKFLVTKKTEEREVLPAQVRLIEPRHERAIKAPLIFRWEEIKEREYYILEIFDDSLLPIWKSPKLLDNFFEPPRGLVYQLKKGRSYFWMISAYLLNGTKVESALEELLLTK